MSHSIHELPDTVLSKISNGDREALGVRTREEALLALNIRRESELHDQCIQWLRLHGVKAVLHSRTDKRTTRPLGEPDLVFVWNYWWDAWFRFRMGPLKPVPVAYELKLPGHKPTEDQLACMQDMKADGWSVGWGTSLKDMIEFLKAL